jgi:hypothetical protein
MIRRIRTFLVNSLLSGRWRDGMRAQMILRAGELGTQQLALLFDSAGIDSDALAEMLRGENLDTHELRMIFEHSGIGTGPDGDAVAIVLERLKTDSAFSAELEAKLRSLTRERAILREINRRQQVTRDLLRQNPDLRQMFRSFIEGNDFTTDETKEIEVMLLQLTPDDKSRSALLGPLLKLVNAAPGAELKYRYLKQMAETSERRAAEMHVDGASERASSRNEEGEKPSLRKEAGEIESDELLRSEWDARNVDIQRIYTILGPPPLRTLSGVPHDR